MLLDYLATRFGAPTIEAFTRALDELAILRGLGVQDSVTQQSAGQLLAALVTLRCEHGFAAVDAILAVASDDNERLRVKDERLRALRGLADLERQ